MYNFMHGYKKGRARRTRRGSVSSLASSLAHAIIKSGTWSFNQSLRVPGFRITEEVPVPLSLIEPNARVLILRHEDVVFPTVSDYNIR